MHFWFSQPMYSAESSGLRRNIMEAGLTHGLQLPHKSPDGKPEGTTLPWSPRTMCPAQRVCGRPLWLSSPSRAASGSETISVEFWSNDIQRKPRQAGYFLRTAVTQWLQYAVLISYFGLQHIFDLEPVSFPLKISQNFLLYIPYLFQHKSLAIN